MYELLRPLMRAWYATKMRPSAGIPKPRDSGVLPAAGGDADKVLLLGNGATQGWGVVTHQLGIPGHLQRLVQGTTGRPCHVSYVGDETMNVSSALAWLGDHDVTSYDVVVVALGMNDAVRLTPILVWEEMMQKLLETLRLRMRSAAQIIVAGVQPVRSVTPYDTPLGSVAAFHCGRINTVSRYLTHDVAGATYFRLTAPVLEKGRPHGSAPVYRSWAQDIADHVIPALDTSRQDPHRVLIRSTDAAPVWEWNGAARLVEEAASNGTAELQRLAALAQETFQVDVAVVSLLEGDRLWYGMNTEKLPFSIPRELAYCDTTVRQNAPLVVPHAQKDPRFRGNPFIDVTGMNFYAGHPLRSSTGETIGTFCLLNARPKPAHAVPLDALKSIAEQAEAELRRLEDPHAAQPGPVPQKSDRI